MSRGALTHHFASKHEMMTAAITHLSEVRERELSANARSLAEGPDRIRAVIALLWESFRSELFYASLELWTAARTDAALREALYAVEHKIGARHRMLVGHPLDDQSATRATSTVGLSRCRYRSSIIRVLVRP